MKETVLKTAANAGEKVVQGFAVSKDSVAEVVGDGTRSVKHFLKRTRYTAEDLLDEAAHNIKRFPLGSVMVAFGAGALLGLVVSYTGRK